MTDKPTKIRELNNQFRTSMGVQGNSKIMKTAGINALSQDDQNAIFQKVRDFDDFNQDNDTYGEHDFGVVRHNGHKVFWKIDYYAPNMFFGSEDPSDPGRTVRVLTIMLSHEY